MSVDTESDFKRNAYIFILEKPEVPFYFFSTSTTNIMNPPPLFFDVLGKN